MFPILVIPLRRSDKRIPFPPADHVFEVPRRPTDGCVLFGKLCEVLGNAEAACPGVAADNFGDILGNIAMQLRHLCTSHIVSIF